jgi:hypothetical protein
MAVSINASIYSKCRTRLANLGADDEFLERYHPLLKEHLKVSMVVGDPNARGQRNNTLAWFWSMDVEGDSHNSDWLNECELIMLVGCAVLTLHSLPRALASCQGIKRPVGGRAPPSVA